MRNVIIILILATLQISCDKEDSPSYYSFHSSDYNFIPDNYQETGQIYLFRNNDNEEVKMKIVYYSLKKEYESGVGFGQPSSGESHYYDDLWIGIQLLDVNIHYCNIISIHIRKYPHGILTDLEIPEYHYDLSSCGGSGFEEVSPYENLIELNINGEIFNKIKVVVPNDYFTLYDHSQIDKLYYDFDKGIVGFDDTQNNIQYRLVSE